MKRFCVDIMKYHDWDDPKIILESNDFGSYEEALQWAQNIKFVNIDEFTIEIIEIEGQRKTVYIVGCGTNEKI